MVLNEWYGYPVVSMRNFNTFGANQNIAGHGAVLPTFISKSLKNQPLKIEGDGTQTRDFLYIDDAIDAYELALDNVQKVKGEIFNIGSGIETRITDLADKIIQRTHSKSKKEFIPKRLGDLMALQADTKKIHTMLGWKQKTPFDSALDTTIEWYQQHM